MERNWGSQRFGEELGFTGVWRGTGVQRDVEKTRGPQGAPQSSGMGCGSPRRGDSGEWRQRTWRGAQAGFGGQVWGAGFECRV